MLNFYQKNNVCTMNINDLISNILPKDKPNIFVIIIIVYLCTESERVTPEFAYITNRIYIYRAYSVRAYAFVRQHVLCL